MLPKTHALIGFLFSVFLYFAFRLTYIQVLIVFLASFLIDFDHYMYYVYKKRNFSPTKAYGWFMISRKKFNSLSNKEKKKHRVGFYLFHGLEWILLFLLMGYFLYSLFYFVAIGMFLHLILDWIMIIKEKSRMHKILVLYDYFNKDKLNKI